MVVFLAGVSVICSELFLGTHAILLCYTEPATVPAPARYLTGEVNVGLIKEEMQLRRFIWSLVLVFVMVLALSFTGSAATTVRIMSAPVFSVLPFYWMQETGAVPGVDLQINLSPDHPRNLNLVATGQGEYLITGLNVGAKGYVKGLPIELVNVNTWAVDYVVARDSKIKSWADLVGKRVNLPLQGGPVDFLAQFLIEKEGLQSNRFQFVYAAPPQAMQLFSLGQLDAVVLPEPQVSQLLASDPQAKIVIDIQKDWAKWHKGDDSVPYVGLFVRGPWATQNPTLANQIAQAYAKGVKWMNDNPQAAAKMGAKVLDMPETVVAQALKRTRLAIYDSARTKALTNEHLEEMLQFSPDLVGGKVPDAGFYR